MSTRAARSSRTAFGSMAIALALLATGCAGAAEGLGTADRSTGSTTAPTVATTGPPATSAPTTEATTTTAAALPDTSTSTTATPPAAPTTGAPAPVVPARAPRPLPPKPGRPAPPEAIALPGPAVVPGEGEWTPLGTSVGGSPAMYRTNLRSGPADAIASIVWIDQKAVRGQLFPGTNQPGGGWTVPFNVPIEQKPELLAAFNSGFLLAEAEGGFYLEGRAAIPLRDGTAAVAIDTSGTITIGMLGRDFAVGPEIASIRQNLPLLVDGGAIAASATDRDAYVWGKTLGGGAAVWRSGFGMRADGSLVYVAGPAMTARGLANTLVAAGAVRAMELDINPNWVTFNVFAFDPSTAQSSGTKLMPNMLRDGNRYLTPENRDFFALFSRPDA